MPFTVMADAALQNVYVCCALPVPVPLPVAVNVTPTVFDNAPIAVKSVVPTTKIV